MNFSTCDYIKKFNFRDGHETTFRHPGLAVNNNNDDAFTSADIPSSKEPHGLVRSDGKRPDGLTLVPWKEGKPLASDDTAVCTVADSYVAATAREAGAAAERAAELKISKYSDLEDNCVF